LDQMRLASHAELLKDAGGGEVARLGAANDAVHAHRVEREIEQWSRCLGRVASALMRRVNHEAQLALRMPLADPPEREISDELTAVAQDDGRAHAVALACNRHPGDLPCQRGPHLVDRASVVI